MNVAIVGATGNVGRKTLEVLEKKNLPIKELYLVASPRSVGSKSKRALCKYTLGWWSSYKLEDNVDVSSKIKPFR